MQTSLLLNHLPHSLNSFLTVSLGRSRWAILPMASLVLGVLLQKPGQVQAQTEPTAASAPSEVSMLLSNIDAAATQQDLEAVMQFYSPNFTSPDGITYNTLEDALETFWERFSQVTYQTSLNSLEQDGEAVVIETTTQITGNQDLEGRSLGLNATITSRQRLEGGQIVQQEILTEESRLTTGDNPPEVTINLPESVTVGQSFVFDAIVEEPLGDRYLLGSAIEEPIEPEAYLNSPAVNLELLSAGGLFKIGRAPVLSDDRWISAVLVREDGIVVVTRRLQVTERE